MRERQRRRDISEATHAASSQRQCTMLLVVVHTHATWPKRTPERVNQRAQLVQLPKVESYVVRSSSRPCCRVRNESVNSGNIVCGELNLFGTYGLWDSTTTNIVMALCPHRLGSSDPIGFTALNSKIPIGSTYCRVAADPQQCRGPVRT